MIILIINSLLHFRYFAHIFSAMNYVHLYLELLIISTKLSVSLFWLHFGFNASYCATPRCHLNCRAATVIDYLYVDIYIYRMYMCALFCVYITNFYIKTHIEKKNY